jgi:diguanylate cyclase
MLSVPVIYFFMSKLRELAVAHERLAIFASTDALTGMLNRGAFTTLVDSRLDQHPADGTPLLGAVLIMDVDNFKAINDQHGHEHGDTALQLISRATRAVLRQTDLLGRIGGEEFAILLEGADQPIAEAIAERIRLAVTDIPFSPQGRLHPLSVSVGGVVFDRRVPLSDLLRIADRELYAAKRDGRNRVAISPIADFGSVPAAAE